MKNKWFNIEDETVGIYVKCKVQEYITKVDIETFETKLKNLRVLWYGKAEGNGTMYIETCGSKKIDMKKIKLHRYIMNPSKEMVIDHINGDRFDNTRKNLRIVTQKENLQNRGLNRKSSKNKTGISGISYGGGRHGKLWTVNVGGKFIGSSVNFEKALKMKIDAEKKFLEELEKKREVLIQKNIDSLGIF